MGADQHLSERGSTPVSRKQLAADARWHRSEADRLASELTAMSPEHAAAIGDTAVRRMQVDHETNLQLAQELEAYLKGSGSSSNAGGAEEAEALF